MTTTNVEDVVEGEVVEGPTVAALAMREPLSALVEPAADMETIGRAFVDYQELTKRLLNDSDYQNAGRDGRFVKKSGWRKLAVAFGVTFEFRHKEVTFEDPARGRGVLRAEFIYRATAPNGRFADGWGACSAFERCCDPKCSKSHRHCERDCNGFVHFSKADHDIPATAETRAKNRAASDLFGMGQVSAEEVFGTAGDQSGAPTAAGADPWQTATPAPRRKAAEASGTKRPAEPAGGDTQPASGSAGAPIDWASQPILARRAAIDEEGPDRRGGDRTPGSATPAQTRKMAVLAGKFGWDDDERHRQAEVESWSKLSKAEASYLIDQWDRYEKVLEAEREEAAAAGEAAEPGKPSAAASIDALLAHAKAIYHGTLLTKARLFDKEIRAERDIPADILRELIENNV